MGRHVRFDEEEKREEDEDAMILDVEEEEEEKQQQQQQLYDFGPDPEFRARTPIGNLMIVSSSSAAKNYFNNKSHVIHGKDNKDKEETYQEPRRKEEHDECDDDDDDDGVVSFREIAKREKGSVYVTQMETNFDFSKMVYRTSANEGKVFDVVRNGGQNNNMASSSSSSSSSPSLKHERAVTDTHFPVPNELTTILSCSHDNTVKEWDARTNNTKCVARVRIPNHILGKNGSVETCSIGGANETILAVSCGEKILFYDRRMIRQGGGEVIKQFEDAHSEIVTKLRFHPENRHILHTSSVDGLTCTFNLFNEIDDENSLVSIGTANAAINEFGFLSGARTSSNSKNILWALTGIEEIHLFDCDANGTTCGVEIGRVKNAREKAREAAKEAKMMNERKISSKSLSKKGLKDLIENGVDYVINVIDGGIANNHKYYACCGTINGTVGLFPIAYDQNGMKSGTSTQPLTLLAPEYVLPNDSSSGGDGHNDIVRCLVASSSSTVGASDGQKVHLYTGGEDSLVCAWTTTKERIETDANNTNNNNSFLGGALRNSPSSSFRSGRESPY